MVLTEIIIEEVLLQIFNTNLTDSIGSILICKATGKFYGSFACPKKIEREVYSKELVQIYCEFLIVSWWEVLLPGIKQKRGVKISPYKARTQKKGTSRDAPIVKAAKTIITYWRLK